MFILANFIGGMFRELLYMIDMAAYTFVDEVYNVFVSIATARIDSTIVKNFANNVYILVAVYALFVIAKLLINIIVNPDISKDTKDSKGKSMGSIFSRLAIALFGIVCLPIIFNMAYELQADILKRNIIFKLVLGDATDTTNKDPGDNLKLIALTSLIRPLDIWAEYDAASKEYVPKASCNGDCQDVINKYNLFLKKGNMPILATALKAREKYNGEKEYILSYTYFAVTAMGIFITYILLSYSIDMAVRVFKLGLLEMFAPAFVATYIDNSEKSPYKKWQKQTTNTYIEVFMKTAIMALLVFFVSLLGGDGSGTFFGLIEKGTGKGWLTKLMLLFGVLIFFKQAPKLIKELLGLKDDGKLFGGSIKDKLGGAAIIGDKTKKGMNAISGGLKRGLGSALGGTKMGLREGKNLKSAAKQGLGGLAKGMKLGGIAGYSGKDTKGYWREGRKVDPRHKTLGERFTGATKSGLSELETLAWQKDLEKNAKNNALRSKLGMRKDGNFSGKPVTANTFAIDPNYSANFTGSRQFPGKIITQANYDDFLGKADYAAMSFDGKKEFQLLFQKQKQQDLQTYIEINENLPGLAKKKAEAQASGASTEEIGLIQSQIDTYSRELRLIEEKIYTTKDANGNSENLNPNNASKILAEAGEAISKAEKGELEKAAAPTAPAPAAPPAP